MINVYCNDKNLKINNSYINITNDIEKLKYCDYFIFNIKNNISCVQIAEVTYIIAKRPFNTIVYYSENLYRDEINLIKNFWNKYCTNHAKTEEEFSKFLDEIFQASKLQKHLEQKNN